MKKLGLAAVLALVSTSAFAGSFEIPIKGGVARIQFGTKCRDRVCGSVSWSEHGKRGERHEFKIPGVAAKTIANLIDSRAAGLGLSGSDNGGEADAPTSKPRSSSDAAGKHKSSTSSAPSSGSTGEVSYADPIPPAPRSSIESDSTTNRPPSIDATPEADATRSLRSPVRAAGRAEPKVAAVAPSTSDVGGKSSSSPVGEWQIEGGEGRVRIEECGANLCGYVSATKKPGDKDRNNPNAALRSRSLIGIPVLIAMKPNGHRWTGRAYNVKDGRTYTANISLKGSNALRIEGCAFAGLICAGQTWSRVN
jgi:uncharacterized protein (DUF2147 family)